MYKQKGLYVLSAFKGNTWIHVLSVVSLVSYKFRDFTGRVKVFHILMVVGFMGRYCLPDGVHLRALFLHLFLEKTSAVGWQRAADDLTVRESGIWCGLSGRSQWCSAGDGEVPLRDFHSLSPPKEVPHLLSQMFGVENLGETNLQEFYAADQQGSCGCAAEETNCLGSLAVLTLLWKMFHFPEQWQI